MEEWIKDRNEAFASMDEKKIRAYMKKYNISIPEKEEVFWAGVHKVICNLYLFDDINFISIEQYNKSYDWLQKHGYSPSIGGGK